MYTNYLDGRTDERRKKSANVVSTNPIYRCEEFEADTISIYDEIEEDPFEDASAPHPYLRVLGYGTTEDLNDKTFFQDLVPGDKTEGCDEYGAPPALPSLREEAYLQILRDDEEQEEEKRAEFEECNKPQPEVYLEVLADETEGCDEDSKPPLPSPRQTERVYPEVLGEETEEDSKNKHAHLQVLSDERRDYDSKCQEQNQDQNNYEALKQNNPEHLYVPMLNDATERHDQDTDAQDQLHQHDHQGTEPEK